MTATSSVRDGVVQHAGHAWAHHMLTNELPHPTCVQAPAIDDRTYTLHLDSRHLHTWLATVEVIDTQIAGRRAGGRLAVRRTVRLPDTGVLIWISALEPSDAVSDEPIPYQLAITQEATR